MTSVGKLPWSRIRHDGAIASVDQLLSVTGLDWTVSTHPLISARTGAQVRNFRETVRDDNGASLGVVGGHFHPIQNRDAFCALPEVFGAHGLTIEGGGVVYGGAQVWVLAGLGKHEFPTRRLANGELDVVGKHLLFFNAHDGSSRTKVAAVPFAFWCANTLARAWAASTMRVAVKHTSRGTERLLSMTAQVRAAIEWQDAYLADLIALEAQAMKATEMRAFAEQLIADVKGAMKSTTTKDGSLDKRGDERRETVEKMVRLFEGEGVTCLGRSKMDAIQAVTEWVDHHRARARGARQAHEEARGMAAVLDESGNRYRARARELLTRY